METQPSLEENNTSIKVDHKNDVNVALSLSEMSSRKLNDETGNNMNLNKDEENQTKQNDANDDKELIQDTNKAIEKDNKRKKYEDNEEDNKRKRYEENENNTSLKNDDDQQEQIPIQKTCYNPSVTEDDLEDEDFEKMKGDAIGNTLYSERFVLSTLLKLTKDVDLDEDDQLDKDLCALWDMSIEKDVVMFLLHHKVLEVFVSILQETGDRRLVEILLGIIGNMCNVSETRDELCMNSDLMVPLLEMISCPDLGAKTQLMRLLHTALVFENSGDEIIWLQHFKNTKDFVDEFAIILKTKGGTELGMNALEALNAICAKFAIIDEQPPSLPKTASESLQSSSDCQNENKIDNVDNENINGNSLSFADLFVNPYLLLGVNEAFKNLMPDQSELERIARMKDNETFTEILGAFKKPSDTPSKETQKLMTVFLDIHVFLSQYGEKSKNSYKYILNDLITRCIPQILSTLCKPINLLPLTYNEHGIIENVNELFQALDDPFDEICFAQMITIWNLIDTNRESKEIATAASPSSKLKWDDDDDNDDDTTAIATTSTAATTTVTNSNNAGGSMDFDEEVNSEDICMTILEYLTRTVRNADEEQLKNSLRLQSPSTIEKLLSALNAGDSEPDIQECRTKIKKVFDVLKNEDSLLDNPIIQIKPLRPEMTPELKMQLIKNNGFNGTPPPGPNPYGTINRSTTTMELVYDDDDDNDDEDLEETHDQPSNDNSTA